MAASVIGSVTTRPAPATVMSMARLAGPYQAGVRRAAGAPTAEGAGEPKRVSRALTLVWNPR